MKWKLLHKEVTPYKIPKTEWSEMMKNIGFSDDATQNFIAMTESVGKGKIIPGNG